MRLLLIRHAPAKRRSPELAGLDAERPLTRRGARRFERAVRRLAERGLELDALFTSPWRRARQTAELLAPLAAGPPRELELLARAPGPALLRMLHGLEDERSVVGLVGHQPWMGELLALLVLGSSEHGPAFRLTKGAVAVLDGEPARGAMHLRSLWALRDLER